MGAWGAGLYQNDAALDVQSVYRDCKKIGFRGSDLASVVMETAAVDPMAGQDDSALAHLALADLLWKDGMLPADIRQAALRIIADTSLHPHWDEATMNKKRRAVFDALAAKLASPQRPPPPARATLYIEQCDFQIGEVLAFPWPEGKWTLLNVVAYFTKFRGKSPICEVLDWRKKTIPPVALIEQLSLRRPRDAAVIGAARPDETVRELIAMGRLPAGATWKDFEDQMVFPYIPLIRMSDRDQHFHKAKRTGAKIAPRRPFLNHWFVATNAWTGWKGLPDRLENYFGHWPAAKWDGDNPHAIAEKP
jgi:hypothetical protein